MARWGDIARGKDDKIETDWLESPNRHSGFAQRQMALWQASLDQLPFREALFGFGPFSIKILFDSYK